MSTPSPSKLTPGTRPRGLLERLENAVAAHGDRTAVLDASGGSLTYAQLWGRSRALAAELSKRGVAENSRVAVCVDREVDLLVALWGVLAAGACWIPLDVRYPNARLQLMLGDARAKYLVTRRAEAAALARGGAESANGPAYLPVYLEGVDSADASIAPVTDVDADVVASSLAYTIYTSGSTGRPNGVMVSHGQLADFFAAMDEVLGEPGVDEIRVWGAVTSVCFDISILELIYTISRGYTVSLLPAGATPVELGEQLRASQSTHFQCTPSLAGALAYDARAAVGLEQLSCMLVGGEPLPASLARSLRRVVKGRLFNMYGPTETTIWSLYHEVGDETPVPIGRPLANTRYWLLDEQGRVVESALGTHELVLGGTSVAMGYFERDALTCERFMAAPDGEGRAYRTGDYVQERADGVLLFVGRKDQQVKIRGHRVELGDVEHALQEHEGVAEAAVIVRQDTDRRLLAYVVGHGQAGPLADTLRAFLRERLPEYSVPSVIVELDELPRTPNQKIDRKALPAPETQAKQTAVAAPKSGWEERIAGLWCHELGRASIGRDQGFLDIGGDSLMAMRLLTELYEASGVELSIRAFFAANTVAGIARVVEERLAVAGQQASSWPRLRADLESRHEPFPLNEVQQAYWMGRSEAFELGGFSMHGYMEVEYGEIDLDRVEKTLNRLIARHESMRTVILPEGQQRILPEVPRYRLPIIDRRGQDIAETEEALAKERARLSHQVLPVTQWPLFDVQVFLLDGGVRFMVSMDGIMFDAGSVHIVASEFRTLYRDPDAELAPIEMSFRDYVLAEAQHAESEVYARSLSYWQERIETLPAAPQLPTRIVTPIRPEFIRRNGFLPADTWTRLKQRATGLQVTPSGILLAAYAEVLATWAREPHFCINVTLYNRLPIHPQVNATVGDFTSLVLLEVNGSSTMPFVERARRAQDQLWTDLEHRRVSGIRVLRELGKTRPGNAQAPIVFTSTLGGGALHMTGHQALAEEVFAVTQTPQVLLDHMVGENEDGALIWNWDTVEDAFPPGMVDAMFAAYCGLLEELADDDDAWTTRTHNLTPASHIARHAAKNDTRGPAVTERLNEAVLRQVAARGRDTALVSGLRRLSYDELHRRVIGVAIVLTERGVKPGQLVAIVMDEGWPKVVAALAIHQLGAAYVPIEPDWPEQRRAHILAVCEIEVILTESHLDARLPWPQSSTRVPVDGMRPVRRRDLKADPVLGAIPERSNEEVSHIIFTSGTTGEPKGVVLPHRGPRNTLADINQRFDVGPDDRLLSVSAFSFDLSVYDVFGILSAGGRVVFPVREQFREPETWVELMEREGVTVWNSVPAVMEMLLNYVEASGRTVACPLRLVMMSGDWIPVTVPDRIRTVWPDAQIISLGGPTETSIWSVIYPISEVPPEWTSIPYGHALRNQTMHVLDDALRTRPDWVPGEIYIGGDGVGHGYWRQPALTESRFLDHPETGERLYRSGDWGRYMANGEIEFLGREDFQVKIHGFRIELGEIEHVVEEHPEIARAVAVAPGRHVAGEARAANSESAPKLVLFIVRQHVAPVLGQPVSGPESSATSEPGVIADELARIDFRLSKPGIRRDLRGERFSLDRPALDRELRALFFRRRTERRFAATPMTHAQLSGLLLCLMEFAAEDLPFAKLRYASAGNLYPVQVYLYVKNDRVSGLAGGTYYYDRETHELVLIQRGVKPGSEPGIQIDRSVHTEVNRPIFDQSALSLYLIADDSAIRPIYGERAREFCLLEAGYMGQLLQETAGELALGAAPVGYQDFASIHGLFELTEDHWLTHCLFVGPLPERDEPRILREVRDLARARLAPYMVPADIRFLDKLPLSANGKVDRKMLTRMAARRQAPSAPVTGEREARTSVGQSVGAQAAASDSGAGDTCLTAVTDIWQRVLRQSNLDSTGNFFELGGNSLIAAQLVATLRSRMGVELPLRTIFDHPHLFDFVEQVRSRFKDEARVPVAKKSARAETYPIVPRVRAPDDVLPISPGEAGGYFMHRTDDPECSFSTVPMLFELEGALDESALERAIGELLKRHELLRSVYFRASEETRKRILPWQPFQLARVAVSTGALEDMRESVFAQVADKVRKPLDIESGLSFEGHLFRLRSDHNFLLLVMDHIMVDGPSFAIITRDLFAFYDAFALGRPPRLHQLPYQYADYVDYLREQVLDSEQLKRQEAYWLDKLAGVTPVELPTDHPRTAIGEFIARRHTTVLPAGEYLFRISDDLRRRVQEVAEAGNGTLFMTLLASFAALVARRSGQIDISAFSSYFHREVPGTEELVGLFSAFQLLRVELDGDPRFIDILARVRETVLQARANPDFRVAAHVPKEMFRLNFNYHVDEPRTRESESGLRSTLHNARRHIGTRMEFTAILRLIPTGEVVGTMLYCSLIYEHATLANFCADWLRVLERIVADPQTRLSALC